MSLFRINSNVNSILAQRVLAQHNRNLNKSLEQLSTGYRINRGSDDPAGLVASENLRSEMVSLSAAITNAERAGHIASVMEGGLQEVGGLLQEVQGLITANSSTGGLSDEEKQANQLQIDQILQAIDRIASTTTFNGIKLLNGSQDFHVSNMNSIVTDYSINSAKLKHGKMLDVDMIVMESAQRGTLFLNFMVDHVMAGGSSQEQPFTVEVAGAKGTREFSFSSGTPLASVAEAINLFEDGLGVVAEVSGNYVKLQSSEFGSDHFVSVDVKDIPSGLVGSVDKAAVDDTNVVMGVSRQFISMTAPIRDKGRDISAVINGVVARGKGLAASISSDALDMSITLDGNSAASQTIGSLELFRVTNGGMVFNIGPEVNINSQIRLGIGSIASRNLGNSINGRLDELGSGGLFDVDSGKLDSAQKIVNSAIDDIAQMQGRMGGFQKYVVQSSIKSFGVALENLTAAESAIRDTDFAQATADLTRHQVLSQVAVSVLAIANSQAQAVLALL